MPKPILKLVGAYTKKLFFGIRFLFFNYLFY